MPLLTSRVAGREASSSGSTTASLARDRPAAREAPGKLRAAAASNLLAAPSSALAAFCNSKRNILLGFERNALSIQTPRQTFERATRAAAVSQLAQLTLHVDHRPPLWKGAKPLDSREPRLFVRKADLIIRKGNTCATAFAQLAWHTSQLTCGYLRFGRRTSYWL